MESMIPFSEFEKTPRGDAPYRLSASHPDGKYLAMQAGPGPEGLVWEKETKQIVWKPDRAIVLAWLRNGTQIAVFREGSTSYYGLLGPPTKLTTLGAHPLGSRSW